jgi:hypothetical protein
VNVVLWAPQERPRVQTFGGAAATPHPWRVTDCLARRVAAPAASGEGGDGQTTFTEGGGFMAAS